MTAEDLAGYKHDVDEHPPEIKYHNDTVVSGGSAGVTLLMMLNIVEQFGLTSTVEQDGDMWRRVIEAFRYAQSNFTQLGDMSRQEVQDHVNTMLDKSAAREVAEKIISSSSVPDNSQYGEVEPVPRGVTDSAFTEVVAVDKDGLIVAAVFTLGSTFGAELITDHGIILNDAMMRYSETGGNGVTAGGRSLVAALPVVVYHRGELCLPRLALAATGRPSPPPQLDAVLAAAQVILGFTNLGRDVTQAVKAPRLTWVRDDNSGAFAVEDDFQPSAVAEQLTAAGYDRGSEPSVSVGVVQLLERYNNTLVGQYDDRAGHGGVALLEN